VADAARGHHRQVSSPARRGGEALQRATRPEGRLLAPRARRGPRAARRRRGTLLCRARRSPAVASTTLRARPTASMSALSSRGLGLLG
jgi:hypothetical protein